MKKLWVASIILATLGSAYPFNFQVVELDLMAIGAFLQSCCTMPGRGDVLGNVILFVPIGTWLIYRLIPFIPSIDLQLFKDSLKPAFDFQMAPANIIRNTAAWVVVAYLLRIARRGVRRQEIVLILLLFSTIAVTGLAPFEFRANSAPFNLVATHGSL